MVEVIWDGKLYTCQAVGESPPEQNLPPEVPWDVDLRFQVARRSDIARWPGGRWPERKLSDITHITIHHIGAIADPLALSKAYLYKDVGRPAPPYTLWIERDGVVKKLLHLNEASWHSHSWPKSDKQLSIGVNGALHKYLPTEAQLDSLVKVCKWVIEHPEMNVTFERVTGHMDWFSTECPGWKVQKNNIWVDHWKEEFFRRLSTAL